MFEKSQFSLEYRFVLASKSTLNIRVILQQKGSANSR